MAARSVIGRSEFQEDVRAQLRWLRRRRPASWGRNLRIEIERLRERLSAQAGMGRLVGAGGTVRFRLLKLGRLPYVVYLYYDEADATSPVHLARLFHTHRDRASFSPEEWT